MCRMAHNALHATGIIPPKPTRAEMLEAIQKATSNEIA